jgi:hypothetical protein
LTQIDIDFSKRARSRDPETSHRAAAKAVSFAHGHYALIIGSLGLHGPQTIYELAANIGLTHVQVARRLPEITEVVCRTGKTRPGPTGRDCGVWDLKSAS